MSLPVITLCIVNEILTLYKMIVCQSNSVHLKHYIVTLSATLKPIHLLLLVCLFEYPQGLGDYLQHITKVET